MSFGHPYILNTTGCIHDGWLVLSPQNDNVNQDYFYHLLGSPLAYAEFERLAAGAVVKNLNSELVRGVKVPFPPLAEQRRIADILDKADAIRRKRKEGIALTEELLRSAFLDMFGDPVTNPKGWPVQPLGELAATIDYGVTASASTQRIGPQFLRITDIQDNRVNWATVPFCECDSGTARRAKLAPGDIVFARTGATTGKSFWIRECPDDAVFASYLIRVRPGASVLPAYLSEFFQSAGYWAQVRSMAEGAAQPGVNASKLASLKVPLPPAGVQQGMANVVARVAQMQARAEGGASEADTLFNSLVTRAFSGALKATR
jgi:type I restriction enzyme S subunit